jgi:hypothetical protein
MQRACGLQRWRAVKCTGENRPSRILAWALNYLQKNMSSP